MGIRSASAAWFVVVAAGVCGASCTRKQPPASADSLPPPAADAGVPPAAPADGGVLGPPAGDAAGPPAADGATSAALGAPTGAGATSGFARHYRYAAPRCAIRTPAPSLPVALEGVAVAPVLENWGLDDAAKALLAKNGFAIVHGERFPAIDEIPELYERLSGGVPVFVTADTVLHLYHLVFDALLMTIEEQDLSPLLGRLVDAVRAEAAGAADAAGLPGAAARDVLAFCDVVRGLLDETAAPDPRVAGVVSEETRLIRERASFQQSAVFGYQEDYSQYIPRGHYTRTPALTRYFLAMMWIGRMSWLLKADSDRPQPGLVPLETARRHTAAAALLARWLGEAQVDGRPALEAWTRIYDVTAFFAGFSDDLTPSEVRPVVDEVLGAAAGLEALVDPAKVDLLRGRLGVLRSPQIYSGTGGTAVTVPITEAGDPEALLALVGSTTGVRFMGQRYTPDADLMGRLAFPAVGGPTDAAQPPPFTRVESDFGPIRGFARGLEVMMMLGAPRARPIIDQLRDSAYEKYDEAVAAVQGVFPLPGDAGWHRNLYWSWLEVLAEYVKPREKPTQAFETGEAWQDRTMTAALASWAQLRHDTILYVKQPYVPMPTGAAPRPHEPPPPPKGFVEPNPELFARLIAINEMTAAGLEEAGVLPPLAGTVLRSFGEVLGTLRDLAVKELEDRPIDDEDNVFLVSFGARAQNLLDQIASLNVPPGEDPNASPFERATSAVDTKTTLAADVMTCIPAREVLEEATGRIDMLVVAMRAPGRGDTFLAAGPVLSYYEFRWPMGDRLTDEAWRALLDSERAPAPPPWVCSYRVPCPAGGAADAP